MIRIERDTFTDESTIGSFYWDDQWICYTLEDMVRDGPKVPGKTAIPAGRYRVVIDFSNRFQKLMPHILDVPGFTGIRIHKGNLAIETEGCPLVGMHRTENRIYECQPAFDIIFSRLQAALAIGGVWLDIGNKTLEA
jgi:hypothetical protein